MEVNYSLFYISDIQETPPDELKKLFLRPNGSQYTWKDIDRLFNLCMASRSVLFTMLEHLGDQSYDFSTIKDLSVKWVNSFLEKLEEYSLFETQRILIHRLDYLRAADTRLLAYDNLNFIQQYISKLFLWIDVYIPWKDICETYAKIKGDREPYI